MILDFLLNCDSKSLSTKCQLIQILTEGFTGNCTNHSEQVKQVVYGARGGHGGVCCVFWATKAWTWSRAGGGQAAASYGWKKKPMYSSTKMYFPF